MERADARAAVVAVVQQWVPRYRQANDFQTKNALKSVSRAVGVEAWPSAVQQNHQPLRRKVAEALWAYAVLRDTGTESAEALAALAQG